MKRITRQEIERAKKYIDDNTSLSYTRKAEEAVIVKRLIFERGFFRTDLDLVENLVDTNIIRAIQSDHKRGYRDLNLKSGEREYGMDFDDFRRFELVYMIQMQMEQKRAGPEITQEELSNLKEDSLQIDYKDIRSLCRARKRFESTLFRGLRRLKRL
jgi:hypothetical protein